MKLSLLYEIQVAEPFSHNREAQAWKDAIAQAKKAAEVGFHAIWAVEHHFLVEYAHCSAPEIFLSHLAALTEKIRLGHGVIIATPNVNHPFRIAERVGALDIVSDGRVDAGFGRGFSELEQLGFGVNPETSRQVAIEAVNALKTIWSDEFNGFKGNFLDLPKREIIPRPLQKPHPPLWWACTSPASFELAGQNGLGCLCFAFQPPETLEKSISTYRLLVKDYEKNNPTLNVNNQVAGYSVALCLSDKTRARIDGAKGFLFNLRRWVDYIRPLAKYQQHDFYRQLLDNPLLDALEASSSPSEKELENIGATLTELGYCALGDESDCKTVLDRFNQLGVDQILFLMQTAGVSNQEVLESIEHFSALK
jgi:alkanesulfonate monooxygenase SsuD/methylene tetrahydromethanopterin reductase-like flavin-dependent oxidoreductase (luciferase family)